MLLASEITAATTATVPSAEADGRPLTLQMKKQIMSVLAVVWLLGSGWALYQLQTADQRLFDPTVLETEDYPIDRVQAVLSQSLPQTGTPLIVHAFDDRCACAESARQHLVSMQERIREAGAQVVFLARPDDEARAKLAADEFAREANVTVAGVVVDQRQSLVPASPAAVVVSEVGELIYLGPYSAGGACVTSLGGFVESSLRISPDDFQGTWVNRAVMGCYCDWRAPQANTV